MKNTDKLKELQQLLDEGILTQQEFDAEKAKLTDTVQKEEHVEKASVDINDKVKENDKTPHLDALASNLASQLKDIKDLYDEQLITDEEYQKMRAEALASQTLESNSKPSKNTRPVQTNAGINKTLLIVGGVIIGALLLFTMVGFATQTSQDTLSQQVEDAVTDEDASALLKNFSDEDQKAEWALPGVSELISNWHDVNPSQIVNDLADGVNINTEDDWANVRVTVQSKPHMLFWKTYYLEVTPIKVNAESGEDNYVVLTGNGDDEDLSRLDEDASEAAEEKVAVSDLEENGVFPGWWLFDIQDDSDDTISSNAYMRSYGRGSSYISMDFD